MLCTQVSWGAGVVEPEEERGTDADPHCKDDAGDEAKQQVVPRVFKAHSGETVGEEDLVERTTTLGAGDTRRRPCHTHHVDHTHRDTDHPRTQGYTRSARWLYSHSGMQYTMPQRGRHHHSRDAGTQCPHEGGRVGHRSQFHRSAQARCSCRGATQRSEHTQPMVDTRGSRPYTDCQAHKSL